ncbi:hypothetical protein chiPu_0031699, partial [Chiloscyllium punctatum]|nr:hypothetical protein [Chiloscyllium punctatum]
AEDTEHPGSGAGRLPGNHRHFRHPRPGHPTPTRQRSGPRVSPARTDRRAGGRGVGPVVMATMELSDSRTWEYQR